MDEEEKGEKVDRVHMVKIANQIEKTIRASGTNAIPILLKLLTVPGEEWKANFAFSVLGPTAKPAVPALVEMLKSKNPDVRLAVVYSLGSIGPAAADAVPALIEHVYDNNLYVKINTRHTLSSIHAQSEKVVPLLIESLNELHRTNDSYVASIIALGKFGNEAKTAFPTVLQFLNDTNLAVRALAADALKSIDSEAATKAGVK